MANYQPPQSLWPRWMHVGCLGCSIVLALALLSTAASLGFWVYHSTKVSAATTSQARPLPIVSLDNGCVASVRAEGYIASQAAFLPGGRIVALATPTFDMAKIFGSAFQNAAKPNAPVATAYSFIMPRVVLLDHGVAAELPVPSADNYAPSIQSISVDDAGAHLVASVTQMDVTTAAVYSPTVPGRKSGPSEVWLLDLASRQWTKLLRLPAGQVFRFATWLPDGSAVLGRPIGQSEDKVTDLWALDLRGHVRTVARMPGLRAWKVVSDATGAHLLGFTTAGAPAGRIVTADLATGKTSERPVTDVPGMHPGPLSPDETLTVVDESLLALDWKAARVRHLAELILEVNNLQVAKDGSWAFADLSGPTGAYKRSGLVAINLADGRIHSVSARGSSRNPETVLAPAPEGCGFLASTNTFLGPSLNPEKSEVLEVYADRATLAASPVIKSSEPSPAATTTSED